MEPNHSKTNRNIGPCIHLSVFTKYFIPFGNLIFPLVLWMFYRKNPFLDEHGKQCLNFQISTTLYIVALAFIAFYGSLIFGVSLEGFQNIGPVDNPFQLYQYPEVFPFAVFLGIVVLLAVALFFFEIICVIRAAVKAGEGKAYDYPLNINFIGNGKMANTEPLTPHTSPLTPNTPHQ